MSTVQVECISIPKTAEEVNYMDNVPYENLVESLRPNIAHVVSLVSRFMSNPGRAHWQALKWILRYIKGSLSADLWWSQ